MIIDMQVGDWTVIFSVFLLVCMAIPLSEQIWVLIWANWADQERFLRELEEHLIPMSGMLNESKPENGVVTYFFDGIEVLREDKKEKDARQRYTIIKSEEHFTK